MDVEVPEEVGVVRKGVEDAEPLGVNEGLPVTLATLLKEGLNDTVGVKVASLVTEEEKVGIIDTVPMADPLAQRGEGEGVDVCVFNRGEVDTEGVRVASPIKLSVATPL